MTMKHETNCETVGRIIASGDIEVLRRAAREMAQRFDTIMNAVDQSTTEGYFWYMAMKHETNCVTVGRIIASGDIEVLRRAAREIAQRLDTITDTLTAKSAMPIESLRMVTGLEEHGRYKPSEELIDAVAATMGDPLDATQLATALLKLASAVPRLYRATIAGLCDAWTRSFEIEW
jgi:DNA-directed RNA polymerase subunit L